MAKDHHHHTHGAGSPKRAAQSAPATADAGHTLAPSPAADPPGSHSPDARNSWKKGLRPFFELLVAAAAASIALYLASLTHGGLDSRFGPSYTAFSVTAERGVLKAAPIVQYAEFDGRQYVSFIIPNTARDGRGAIVVRGAVRCSDQYDVHGLTGSIPMRAGTRVTGIFSETTVVDVALRKDHATQVACELNVPSWHTSTLARKFSLYLTPPHEKSLTFVGHPDWEEAREVAFRTDDLHGNFETLDMQGGTTHPHQAVALSPEVDQRLRFLTLYAPNANSVMLTWKDADAQNTRDQLLLIIGALVGLAGTAIYDFLRRVLTE
jgi:hypothetical protein